MPKDVRSNDNMILLWDGERAVAFVHLCKSRSPGMSKAISFRLIRHVPVTVFKMTREGKSERGWRLTTPSPFEPTRFGCVVQVFGTSHRPLSRRMPCKTRACGRPDRLFGIHLASADP